MRLTIASLRLWIVILAVLLVAALAGFFGYARYKAHRIIADLPSKLGVEISRSSNGFTISKSEKGHTAFTLHASNALEYKGGDRATLHDVVITLYGAQGDRSDRISGSEFDYDKKAGIVTAKGEVMIDLQGADLTGSPAAPSPAVPHNDAVAATAAAQQIIHIKTSGLVFDQKNQIATTTRHVEFSTPRGAGQADGATYEVEKGLLVLQSAVELTSDRNGEPVVVHASHAEFLRPSMQAFLLNPVTRYQSDQATADQAIVYFRKDGSAEHIDARGHIHLKTDAGQDLTCGAAKVLLDLKGQPRRADVNGGVLFASTGQESSSRKMGEGQNKGGPQEMHGNAAEGTVTFVSGGILSHAQARDAVSFVDQQIGLAGDPGGSATRELRASQVDVDFVPDARGHAQAEKVLAAGGATAVIHTIRTKAASQNTTIKGDQLFATLRDGHAMTSLRGTGHASVLDVSPNGATNLSSSDNLLVTFNPAAAKDAASAKARSGSGVDSTQVQSIVQEGHFVMVQTPAPEEEKTAAKTSGPDNLPHPATPTRAYAHRADYDASSQLLRLTGSPRVDDGTTDLTADTIEYHRDTQAASAIGNVKATYGQSSGAASRGNANPAPGLGGSGPTHVIAANALLDRPRGLAVFRGQARLWQGPNSVSAPIIELAKDPESLKAYAEPAATNAVTTVMASASGPRHQASVFRVRSRQLIYTDADRKAVFTGTVTADDVSGVIHSDQVEALLLPPAPAPPASAAPPQVSSHIDRITATGHVVLQQPGRRGTGEKLLYTAQDGIFKLTGTFSTPPHLYDQVHGDVSGEALIFNTRDDSVSVTGGQSKAVTNTRTAK
jgi:lipopolysaccharide export system protein LptA